MMLIEEHLGRSDKYNILPMEFEQILQHHHFDIEKKDNIDESIGMIHYYLRCKK